MTIDDLDTPSLVLNVDALDRNLARMAADCKAAGVALRPHVKTHKSPWVAGKQMQLGAAGVCAAKLGEARVMVEGGVSNVLVTTELTPPKMDAALRLMRMAQLTFVVDDAEVVVELGRRAVRHGLEVPVLVDVNVGQNRCGVEPGEPALDLARKCESTNGVRLAGVIGYEGHLQHVNDPAERRRLCLAALDLLAETKQTIEGGGIAVPWVTTAGTGTYRVAIEHGLATEVQPGSYVAMDSQYALVEGLPYENALFVVSGVVSVNRPGQLIIDAGWKTLSTEDGMPALRDTPEATYSPAGDEHGRVSGVVGRHRPGDRVWLVPSHCDTTVNLHSHYCLVNDAGDFLGKLPIAARGRVAS
ncbi:MAG TPA: DSD1 family PLP-dependent enzyme [Candidatus Dormibacteraeota bacterium]|jgi:3-hydroxy-D-aspartate aldolase